MNLLTSPTTSRTAAILVAAAIGLATLTPAAFAAGPDRHDRVERHERGMQLRHFERGMRGGARAGFIALGCGPRATERMEHALVSLDYRVKPTGEQTGLFDELKSAALIAQTAFADTCASLRPAKAEAGAEKTRPNMLEAMQKRLELDQARVSALGDVVPKFEVFFNSLTDAQKAALEPRGHREDHRRGRGADDAAAAAPAAPAAGDDRNG